MLNCMEYHNGPMNIQIYVTLMHIFICYFMTIVCDLGIDGPPIANTLSNLNGFVVMWIYIEFLAKKDPKIRASWFLPNKSCF